MSERTPVLAALTLALSLPRIAAAQITVAAESARVVALDSVTARVQTLIRRADSSVAARRPLDTVRAGALAIITDTVLVARVDSATHIAWTELARPLGRDTAALSEPYALVTSNSGLPALHIAGIAVALPDNSGVDLSRAILVFAQMTLAKRAGSAFHHWSGGALALGVDTAALFRHAYEDVVTAPSRGVRACRRGDLSSCASVLGLSGSRPRPSEWYSAADLRGIFDRRIHGRFRQVEPLASCLSGSDSACLASAQQEGAGLRSPLGASARSSLIAVALERGGAGAIGRLAADSGPIGVRLAAAAGIPEPALLGLWRARVLRSAPTAATGATPRAQWTAAFWVLLLAGLAARSTRWRLD